MKMKSSSAMILGATVIALCMPSAFAKGSSACPSGGTPVPGAHVKGGLEVDGVCVLNGVTVDGGIKVDTNAHLQLQSSTVNGGINVDPGGEVDVNATTPLSGFPTFTSATVNGVINILNSLDFDIFTARIDGGVTLNGSSNFPTFCGNDTNGASSFSNFTGQIGGGPLVDRPTQFCAGNRFQGSLSLTNLTVWIGGNTIEGDLLCSNSIVHVTAPNTITGKNTCY
jgi:hypothetical protein